MAFKLTKTEQAELTEHITKLQRRLETLQDEVRAANDAYADRIRAINDNELVKYNEALTDAVAWASDIASRFQSEYDEKSEAWQDGEKGQAAQDMIGQWEGFTGYELDPLEPVEVDEPQSEDIDTLESLPTELDS